MRPDFKISVFALMVLSQAVSFAAPPTAVDIGIRKQLFVDDYVVSSSRGVERVLNQAVKENGSQPVRFFRKDSHGARIPLKAAIYMSPMYDEQRGVFRLWSRVYPDAPPDSPAGGGDRFARYGYSESRDGLTFDFVSELQGLHSNGDYNSVVTFDAHEADPAHRYKIGYDGARRGTTNGACLAYSADGIHWTPYNNGEPVTKRAADFTNCLTWDEASRTYRLLTRTDYGTGGGLTEIRGMRIMSNPDVKANPRNWTTIREWLFDREGKDEHQRRQIYTMTDWVYCDVHFGLFSVYEWPNDFSEGKQTDHTKRHERDILNYYIATSRDGKEWDLGWIYASRPMVERGGQGAWDKDMILPANWIVTKGDRHYLYYGGYNERHGVGGVQQFEREGQIGLATLRLDGFVSLDARNEPGTVVTKPFRLAGDAVAINVDASAGEISVEVLDETGRPWPGFSGEAILPAAKVDALHWRPQWKGHADLSSLRGKVVQLKFNVRAAKIYSFQVGP